MVDPLNVIAIDDIRLITGFDIEPVIATEESIIRAINNQFGVTDLAEVEDTVKELQAQGPACRPGVRRGWRRRDLARQAQRDDRRRTDSARGELDYLPGH